MKLVAYKRADAVCLGDQLPEGRIVSIIELPDAGCPAAGWAAG